MNRRHFLGSVALGIAAFGDRATCRSAAGRRGEASMPDLNGATGWINTAPLTPQALRGKVVLADIWTYSCINSLRQLPYLRAWAEKYNDAGLVVLGVHSPEFDFEKDRANVERAVHELKLTYPIAIDSERAIWRAFNNEYWPADYFIDRNGAIRRHHFGEGDYDAAERTIQDLLKENGPAVDGSLVKANGTGIEAPPDFGNAQSPETYVGYARAERFVSPERVVPSAPQSYSIPSRLELNQWALGGRWIIEGERGALQTAPGKIAYRFHSRDLHFVLAPARNGSPVRFAAKLDGAAPGGAHGVDIQPDGTGVIREPRCHQLIRQSGSVTDRTFEIEFFDAGVQAFSFTFG